MLVFTTFAIALLALNGCHSDDGEPGPSRQGFGLTTPDSGPTTELTGEDVRAYLNSLPLLSKIDKSLLRLDDFEVPAMASGSSDSLKSCANELLRKKGLNVTRNSVALTFDADLIAECDEPIEDFPDLAEVKNIVKYQVRVGCDRADFSHWFGKTLDDVGSAEISPYCENSKLIVVNRAGSVEARKAVKTKQEGESEITDLKVVHLAFRLSGIDTSDCTLVRDRNTVKIRSCRYDLWSKEYYGHPQFENVDANDVDKENKPSVYQLSIILKGLEQSDEDRFYNLGEIVFELNGWKGRVKYNKNGWASPRWEAQNGSQKVEGIFAAQ